MTRSYVKGSRFFARQKRLAFIEAERASAMASLYRDGKILQEIGDQYGMTRERVRQIITKHFGSLAIEGGKSKRAADRRADRHARKDAQYMASHGCTFSQYVSVRRMANRLIKAGVSRERTPIGAFNTQRCSARRRGIEWQFKFWDWWQFWLASGKWDKRGCAAESFVMCRYGDIGPYAPGNVYIATLSQNTTHYQARRRAEQAEAA